MENEKLGKSDTNKLITKNYILKLTTIAFIVGLISCCSESTQIAEKAESRILTDDLGRQVRLPKTIERAVSLAPNLTENIFAVGAGDRLVGVTTYCDYPSEALRIEKVGDTQTPNAERIVALRPQVVFVSTASQLESFTKTLEEQNIAVFVTSPTTLEGVMSNLLEFGQIFGTMDTANALVADMRHRAAAKLSLTEGRKPVRVFVQISNEPLYTVGKDSFVTEIVKIAGGDVVTKDIATAYPVLSKEAALAFSPEAIILSDSSDNREPNNAFRNSPAVKNGRLIRVDPDILSRPGPRLVEAVESIAAQLHKTGS